LPPVGGNGVSDQSSISADGRYVAFSSKALNLNELPAERNIRQVYVRDTMTGLTRTVSATSGGVVGDSSSSSPSISGDGRFIAYISGAMNLAVGATGVPQVLIWSRDTGLSQIVSRSNDVIPAVENAGAFTVVLSGDGNTVAWSTNSTNLTSENTGGYIQVFEHSMVSGLTALVSRDARVTPATGAMANAVSPSISADGRGISFVTGWQLTSTPVAHSQIYVRDSVAGTLRVASVNQSGGEGANQNSDLPSLSADGRFVAFSSPASDLVAGHTSGTRAVYVRNLQLNTTEMASVNHTGSGSVDGASDAPSLSADGSSVAFVSNARNAVSDGGGFPRSLYQIYVRNLTTGVTVAASRAVSGVGAGDADSGSPAISADATYVAYSSLATNLTVEAALGTTQVYLRNVGDTSRIDRVGGADRFEVAAAVSAGTFAPHPRIVYVASGAVFPDALSGSAAAGSQNGPVLLVSRDTIPASVATELTRLSPQTIVVLGGESTINSPVEAELHGYATNVVRVSGADRYEVSAAISANTFGAAAPVAYVASGATFPDALSGSAAAGLQKGPVLLVKKDGIPVSVSAELARLAPAKIVVLGGTTTIAESVVATLRSIAPTTRIGGPDRFTVSAAVSAANFPANTHTVYVASGAVFPDALSGSAAAIQTGGPVLLVTKDEIPAPVAAELNRLNPKRIVVLGGTNTISETTLNAMRGFLAP
jgi:putative cell wall-binding protein/Tol biopolymer transport system component